MNSPRTMSIVSAVFVMAAALAGGSGAVAVASQATSRPASGDDWLTVAAGELHTCAIREDHTLWCWGSNSYGGLGQGEGCHFGQLGLGYPASRYVPTQVEPGTHWSGVAAGSSHTCATGIDGSVWCWGRGGQNLWCWGANDEGQLGLGDRIDRNRPTQV